MSLPRSSERRASKSFCSAQSLSCWAALSSRPALPISPVTGRRWPDDPTQHWIRPDCESTWCLTILPSCDTPHGTPDENLGFPEKAVDVNPKPQNLPLPPQRRVCRSSAEAGARAFTSSHQSSPTFGQLPSLADAGV